VGLGTRLTVGRYVSILYISLDLWVPDYIRSAWGIQQAHKHSYTVQLAFHAEN